MTVQKTLSSWLTVEEAQYVPEFVVVNKDQSHEVVAIDDDNEIAMVVEPNTEPPSQPNQEVLAAVEPSIESMKLTLRGRTVIFCGMTKREQNKEFADGFEGLLEPIVHDDKIMCWWLKADKVPRLKELIGYFRERSEKMSDLDAVAYAVDIGEWFAEPRSYLLEVNFLPKLARLTKASLRPCVHFEIIQHLSDYFRYADLCEEVTVEIHELFAQTIAQTSDSTRDEMADLFVGNEKERRVYLDYVDVFLASENQHLLYPPPAAIVESSLPEAIIEFLETGQEPPFLSPGKAIFVELVTLFKPLKEKLLQTCTVEKLSEYLNDVDQNPKTPCPFDLAPETQAELQTFLTLYIKHRFTPLCVEEEPPSFIELQTQGLKQLAEAALAAIEKAVHSANLNITFDRLNGEVRLEKNRASQGTFPSDSDDDLVVIAQSEDPDSLYS